MQRHATPRRAIDRSPPHAPRAGRRAPAPGPRRWAVCLALVVGLLLGAAAANRIAVPDLPARVGVPADVAARFVEQLRDALREIGLEVEEAPLITAGIAGSLEPDFALLVAELESVRFAVSGELVARPGAAAEPYAVNLLAVDAVQRRSTDVLSRPLALATLPRVASEVAAFLQQFVAGARELPVGDAGLFVSTEPRSAEVLVDGVRIGLSGVLDLVQLLPGRYELEVRRDGYLPELRTVDLRSGDTRFVHVVLTEVAGGSIRVTSVPAGFVYLDGVPMGTTPVTLTSLPGQREVRIERPGFESAVFTVSVRDFRVHRVDAMLAGRSPTVLVWALGEGGSIIVDGVLQRDGYAAVEVGLVTIERARAGSTRRVIRAVPAPGVYLVDLETLDLTPLER